MVFNDRKKQDLIIFLFLNANYQSAGIQFVQTLKILLTFYPQILAASIHEHQLSLSLSCTAMS